MSEPVQAVLAGLNDEIRNKQGIETVIPAFVEAAGGDIENAIRTITELAGSGDLDKWLPRSRQDIDVDDVFYDLDVEVRKKPGIKSLIKHVLNNGRNVAETVGVINELWRDGDIDEMVASAVAKEVPDETSD